MATIGFPSLSTSSRLPSGVTYSYVYVPPKGNKPYILFCHGFPDSSHGWRHQIPYFQERGYGLVVPDLLGYGGTDKPKEAEAYRLKKMSDEVVSLLDILGIDKVISIGHDWGSSLLSRLANYHPSRFSKYAWLDVGYRPPAGPFDLDAINKMTEQNLGYPIFGYWHFFNDEDAEDMMNNHPESMKSLLYAKDPNFMKDNMCYIGAVRKYFDEGKTGPLASWATQDEIKTHEKIFDPSNGGYGPCLNWYRAAIRHFNDQDDAAIKEADYIIKQPTLLLTCSRDPIGVPAIQEMTMKPFVENLTVESLDSGHFVQKEKADEVNKILEAFIEKP